MSSNNFVRNSHLIMTKRRIFHFRSFTQFFVVLMISCSCSFARNSNKIEGCRPRSSLCPYCASCTHTPTIQPMADWRSWQSEKNVRARPCGRHIICFSYSETNGVNFYQNDRTQSTESIFVHFHSRRPNAISFFFPARKRWQSKRKILFFSSMRRYHRIYFQFRLWT